jgi:hypothetical protein
LPTQPGLAEDVSSGRGNLDKLRFSRFFIRKLYNLLLSSPVMKKYITCTLFTLSITYILYAQGNARSEIYQISTPFTYANDISLNGKNFYFDSSWVKAKLLVANNKIISSDSFLFNFDKIDHRLLITTDFKRIFEIDRREFKAILFYWHDSAYIFKHINFINDKDLFEVIISDDTKYSLYKVTRTKLVKGHYGGSSSSATNDRSSDVYINEPEYYIFFPNREYRTIHFLKRASIERIFKLNPDSDVVSDFLRTAGDKGLYGENELKQLILYLNKQVL